MRWNKIPTTFDGEEEIIEGISEVLVKNQTEEEYKLIGKIKI